MLPSAWWGSADLVRLVRRMGEAPSLDVLELIGSFGFRYTMVGRRVVFRVTAGSNLRMAQAERWGDPEWTMDGTRSVLLVFEEPLAIDLAAFAREAGGALDLEHDRACITAGALQIELQLDGSRVRSVHACVDHIVPLVEHGGCTRDSRP